MPSAPSRALIGFAAAALSVLTFHQAMWAMFYAAGQMPLAPYPMLPTLPLGVPLIVSLCFWGGLYGAVFGLLVPRLAGHLWLWGLGLGLVAAAVGILVVAPVKGRAIDLSLLPVFRSVAINGFWGIGVGVIVAPLLRATRTASA